MLPAIGSLSALNSGGRLGVTVDARPLAPPQDGRQLVALQLQTVDRRDAQGQAASRVSGLAPLPAEASERPGASRRVLAAREERAGAATARLQDQLSPAQDDAAARLRLRRYADAGQEPPQTPRYRSDLLSRREHARRDAPRPGQPARIGAAGARRGTLPGSLHDHGEEGDRVGRLTVAVALRPFPLGTPFDLP